MNWRPNSIPFLKKKKDIKEKEDSKLLNTLIIQVNKLKT